MTECPKCGSGLLRNAKSCACGWGKPPRQSAPQENNRDCAYQENHLRCRYPGAISSGTTGGGPWFCRIHARDRGSMIASQVLRASQTWCAKSPVEDTPWLDENLPRHEGETQHDYHFRCRDFALPALKGFRPKPVLSLSNGPMALGHPGPAPGPVVSSGLKRVEKPEVGSAELVVF